MKLRENGAHTKNPAFSLLMAGSDGRNRPTSQGNRNMHSTTTTESTPTMKVLTPDQIDEVSGGWGLIAAAFNYMKTGSPTGDLCDVPNKAPAYCALPKA
jgi:hypothetical protein